MTAGAGEPRKARDTGEQAGSERRLPRVVKTLGWVALFNDVATEMVYPLLPAFLKSIGAGAVALGLMEGTAESVSAVVKWIAGRSSDGRARKPLVLFGYALATILRPLLALAMTAWQVIAIRTADRIGKGIRAAPRDALVAGAVPAEQRGYAFGFHNMMDNIGAVCGPLAAFALVRGLGWSLRAVFAATILPGLFAVATMAWGVKETRGEPAELPSTLSARPEPARGALPARLRAYLGLVALFTLGASADSFLMLRLVDLGLAAQWIPLAWISLNTSKALLNVPGGKISDRFGRPGAQVAGWLVYAAAYALFPTTRSVALTWGLLIAYGAYYGLTEGGEKALVADLTPAEMRGRGYGALHAITGIAVLPANAIFGLLYAEHVAFAFWASAGCALMAAIGLALLARGPNRDHPSSSEATARSMRE
jgi:MFS family permease